MKIVLQITAMRRVLQFIAGQGKGLTFLWGAGLEKDRAYLDVGPLFFGVEWFNLDNDTDEDTGRTVH